MREGGDQVSNKLLPTLERETSKTTIQITKKQIKIPTAKDDKGPPSPPDENASMGQRDLCQADSAIDQSVEAPQPITKPPMMVAETKICVSGAELLIGSAAMLKPHIQKRAQLGRLARTPSAKRIELFIACYHHDLAETGSAASHYFLTYIEGRNGLGRQVSDRTRLDDSLDPKRTLAGPRRVLGRFMYRRATYCSSSPRSGPAEANSLVGKTCFEQAP